MHLIKSTNFTKKITFILNISNITNKSDFLGIIASSLCLVHCLVTPFIFIAQGVSLIHEEHPLWWSSLDIVFLVISFIAIRWSTRTTTNVIVKYALWISWALLLGVIVNEKLHIIPLAEEVIYFVTLLLVGLHFYNRNYCRCKDSKCCVDKN